jgi:cardiolipin synthase
MNQRTHDVVAIVTRLSRSLPPRDVERLADAVRMPGGLSKLRTEAGEPVRAACLSLQATRLEETECHLVAGVLLGSLQPNPAAATVETVWTGPPSGNHTTRLTSAVLVDLIGAATTSVLLVGFAVHNEPSVTAALTQARTRGVTLRLVLERTADNPRYNTSYPTPPFPGVDAERLCWPSPPRPDGAALHAKILVIDDDTALVGSANITGAALGKNLECGLLVRGGPAPHNIRRHVQGLVDRGELHPAT